MNKKHLISVCLLFLALGSLRPADAAIPVNSPANPKVVNILNRLSFGPRPGDGETVANQGVEAYMQQQLHPDSIPEPQALTDQLSQLETLNLTPLQLFEQTTPPKLPSGEKLTPEQEQVYRDKARLALDQAIEARLLQATESPRQLQEEMVDFWYNHFNVFSGKGPGQFLVGAYERQAIRPNALGRFRDLLGATAHHPAMLYYLDNWQSIASNPPGNAKPPQRQKQGLNENYARELMELHTLGVNGGYSQQDVITLAKILTGWTFRRSAQPGVDPNGFYFDAKHHDSSDKVFLGHQIKGGGMEEGEQALDILAKSPATAHHISYQLVQYFLTDKPPQALVERLAKKFLATDGDMREVLSTLFHSPEFSDPQYYSAKFKTPYQYAISAVRASGIHVKNIRPINGILQQLGMPLYGCLTPDGYKNTADVWVNPDAITRRIGFATALASGRLPLTTPPAPPAMAPVTLVGMAPSPGDQPMVGDTRISRLVERTMVESTMPTPPMSSPMSQPAPPIGPKAPIIPVDPIQLSSTLGNSFSSQTQQAIAKSPPELRAALILGSPEFMRR